MVPFTIYNFTRFNRLLYIYIIALPDIALLCITFDQAINK